MSERIYQWQPEFHDLQWQVVFQNPVSPEAWVQILFKGKVDRKALEGAIKTLELFLDDFPPDEAKAATNDGLALQSRSIAGCNEESISEETA